MSSPVAGTSYRHLLGDDDLDDYDSKELFFRAELWLPLSSKSAGSSRKPGLPRRKSDRRESLGGFSNAYEERKIKEKPSWFRGYGGSASVGNWSSVTCKLTEEGDKCSLNVYVDDSILQHSIYIHLLRSTDIRLADRSLFFPSDCLYIHAKAGQRWMGNASDDAIYLKFLNIDELNTWLALLRSYTTPEIYGRRLYPQEGGLYRMWRRIELVIKEGRHFSAPKINDDGLVDPTESQPTEMDIYCEININNSTFGRTIVKNASGSFTLGAKFIFDDLPPFDKLQINVLTEKRNAKPSLLGSIAILLSNFRRGSELDVWYPVIGPGTALSGFQVGELRLSLKVDEEIILPSHSYSTLLKTISRRNGLDILNDLNKQLGLNVFPLVDHMVYIAISHNVLTRDIIAFAEGEVNSTPESQNTLFRGKTVLTKAIDCAMNCYGKRFLEASVGPIIRRFCGEKPVIDMAPARVGKKELDKNAESLAYWCGEFWNQIYSVRAECPPELRRIFHDIRILVEKRRPDDKILKWQSVSTFCFLRFFAPAILEPQRFGLYPGLPSPQTSHSLKEVAKVIQSLANLQTNSAREAHPAIKQFVTNSVTAMVDYLLFVSSEPAEQRSLPAAYGKHEQLQAMNLLLGRLQLMPPLHREALPLLPNNLLDLPKHAAVISSAVMRSPAVRNRPTPSQLDDFIRDCTEIENKALLSVKKLVPPPQPTNHHRRHSTVMLQSSTQDQSRSQTIESNLGRDPRIVSTSIGTDANTRDFVHSQFPVEYAENTSHHESLNPDPNNRNRKSRPVSVGSSNAISTELRQSKAEKYTPTLSNSALQSNALSRTRSHGAASKLSSAPPSKSSGPDDPKQKKGFLRTLWTRN